jgi:hypothetical protein
MFTWKDPLEVKAAPNTHYILWTQKIINRLKVKLRLRRELALAKYERQRGPHAWRDEQFFRAKGVM